MKNEKGVTLIALALTIMVMLILTSVVLYNALSDGGIFNVTHQSIDETTNKTELEQLHIIVEQVLNDSMTEGYGTYITEKSLYTSIKEVTGYNDDNTLRNVLVSKYDDGSYAITFEDTQRQYKIARNGDIDESYTVVNNLEEVDNIFEGIKSVDEID